jgi:hypothetical protein
LNPVEDSGMGNLLSAIIPLWQEPGSGRVGQGVAGYDRITDKTFHRRSATEAAMPTVSALWE